MLNFSSGLEGVNHGYIILNQPDVISRLGEVDGTVCSLGAFRLGCAL